jgi:GcrA cell cycle regulator
MLKKLEIRPKTGERGRSQRLWVRLGREHPLSDHSARLARRSDSYWSLQMPWTAEAVEDLKRLALEGKSASHIAAALGVGSRNAVIGKASRIGIKLNGGGCVTGAGKARGSALRAQWTASSRPRSGTAALARNTQVSPREGRPAWMLGEIEIGEMRRLRFEDMRESACRWPLGDPRSGDFAYCGLTPAEGQSYCAGHCRMAYRPPQARAVARERHGLPAIGSSWRLS